MLQVTGYKLHVTACLPAGRVAWELLKFEGHYLLSFFSLTYSPQEFESLIMGG